MEFHFIDIGIGNMTIIIFPDGKVFCCDCNITEENEGRVIEYVTNIVNSHNIDVFINTHRDADHMRGIEKLNNIFGITQIWDSGVPGTTTDSAEYLTYMDLNRQVGITKEPFKYEEIGDVLIRIMNGKNDDLNDDANDQSLVVKFEYGRSGILIAGDTSFKPWKELILPKYSDEKLNTEVLVGSHHGSINFFDDPSDEKYYYVDHIKKINPAISIISVGDNVHNLPDQKAIDLYFKHSRGSNQDNKVFRTDEDGSIKLIVDSDGTWHLYKNQ